MLGWHISVYRQTSDGSAPASFGAMHGARLAVWQTGLGGLEWIDELVRDGIAISLGGNGYPLEYTAQAMHLLTRLRGGPPAAKAVWTYDKGDILSPQWAGRTTMDDESINACRPDEWLLIQARDES